MNVVVTIVASLYPKNMLASWKQVFWGQMIDMEQSWSLKILAMLSYTRKTQKRIPRLGRYLGVDGFAQFLGA